MKKCNICNCIVDEISECPICGNTITYEPTVTEDKEKFVWNKYYLIYLLKNTWFASICTVIGLVIAIITKPELDTTLILAIALLIASFLFGVFNRRYARAIQWKYSEKWAKNRAISAHFTTGILALVFFMMSAL
ncbi:MAG: hypothetical protein IIX44_05255 [Clostridia bacterium]|nr:hypothetical protein [Clostridia bacterium]